MSRLAWLSILLVSPLVAGSAPAQTAAASAGTAAIEALVHRIYDRYRADGLVSVPDAEIYTSDTLALLRANTRLLHGDIGAIDGDVFIDAQDFGSITVDAIQPVPRADGRFDVAVRFSDPDNDVRGKRVTLVVERTRAGWRVHDVMIPGTAPLRATLARENATLRHRR